MTFRNSMLASLLALSTFAVPAVAQDAGREVAAVRGDGEAAMAQRVTTTATVTAIDAQNRLIALKGEQGRVLEVYAGPEVRNFDQIRVGDTLRATFIEALALELKKQDAPMLRQRRESEMLVPAADGQPAVLARKVIVVADVMALSRKEGTITLRGPSQTRTLPVRDPAMLTDVKVGDQVEVSYLEGLALDMVPVSGR